MKFETGQRVKWTIGKPGNLITSKGLYLGPSSDSMSTVMVYETGNMSTRRKMDVVTDILEKDE